MIWTSTEERQPETAGTYLVLGETGRAMFARWNGTHWNTGRQSFKYWMPVPERPADKPEYMANYLNRDNNDLAIVLEAITGTVEERINRIWRNNARVQQSLSIVRDAALCCLNDLVDGLNQDQKYSIDLRAKKCAIRVLCTAAPAANENWYVVNGNDLVDIAIEATDDCEFCTKTAKEMQACKLRRTLARLGIVTDSITQGDCPYIDQASVEAASRAKLCGKCEA